MIHPVNMDFENDSPQGESGWRAKLAGGLLVFAAFALAACLATYDVHEMGWSLLNPFDAAEAAARPTTNVLGLPGLYLAGLLYAGLGAVAYYLLFLMAVEGVVRLLCPAYCSLRALICLFCMVIFACAAMDIQPWLLQRWAAGLGVAGAGGALGYLDGSCVTEALLGGRFALVVLIVLHAVALIYYARTTPLLVVREAWACLCGGAARLRGWNVRRREAKEQRLRDWRARQDEAARMESAAREAEEEAARQQYPSRVPLAGEEVPRPAAVLPQRQRSNVRPGSTPPAEREDVAPARPFEERDERNRLEDAARPHVQQAPNSRNRIPHTIPSRGDNLLDLMSEVEQAIVLQNNDQPARPMPPSAPQPARPQAEAGRALPAARPAQPRPLPRQAQVPQRELGLDERPQEADYPLPPYELLAYKPVAPEQGIEAQQEMQEMQDRITETLKYFKIDVEPGDITRGPSITRYEFYPPRGLRVNRIANLSSDLMLATKSKSINILAPVPGKNTVGIELANAKKTPVYLRELLQDPAFRSPDLRIPVALGKDVYGRTVIGDLAAMPHTLVAGTTGSGKSVCINSMIISMLYKFRPDELRLILVDPKVVEMQPYRRLPHLACPVVTNPGRVISALRWAVNEMEHRYKLFSKIGVRNFEDFNARSADYVPEPDEDELLEQQRNVDPDWVERFASDIERQAEDEVHLGVEETQEELDFEAEENIPLKLPYIVIIIDELADLMMMVKEDLEVYISRLTQKARAAGIHLVVATQTPRSNIVTGIIKANIPSRIAFKVSSPLDSRIILDMMGAENLLGKGDFLFLPPGGISKMTRAQGAYVSDDEVAAVVKHCSHHARQNFDQNVMSEIEGDEGGAGGGDNGGRIAGKGGNDEDDELYTRCVALVVTERKASTSLLQRRFSIGYGRAAKIIDMMEERGVISPAQGATRAREVLVDAPMED